MKKEAPSERCFACGSAEHDSLFSASDRLYRISNDVFQVVECRQCGLMRLSPQPPPSALQVFYPKSYWYAPEGSAADVIEEIYRRFVLRDHVRFVNRALRDSRESGPVLDVGCGGGLFLELLRQRGFGVVGLDVSVEAARVAWKQNGVPAVCGTLSQAPIAPNSCAAITMFHVLEHLHDPRSYLEAARGLLRPEGRLIVQVPNAACWQFRLLGSAWNGLDVPRHLFDFRQQDLEKLLKVSGFEVLRRKHFSLRDNPAGLATSLAPWLEPMARRVRRVREGPQVKLLKNLLYFAILVAAVPCTALEAACHAGSTIMVEARKTR